uniref:Beta-galactosidase n=1 Tax=Catagonus wagneri TaxID=51154 RepID=A0A8C3WB60_9CETA
MCSVELGALRVYSLPVECLCECPGSFLDVTGLLRSCRVFQTSLRPSFVKDRHVGLTIRDLRFMLGDFPFFILAGTIHYFRVPKEYWRDSLLKLKACGFNTVTTHVPWNLHEPKRGQFYFIGNLDLSSFISMAIEVDLWVILCPGPYIGSDLDLGGLPSWLLQDPKMKLRTTYKGFIKAVNHYFDDLIPRILSLQFQEDGPIIAMQVENEYGSYYKDKKYMTYIKNVSAPLLFLHMYITSFLTFSSLPSTVFASIHMKNIKKETYEKLSSIQGLFKLSLVSFSSGPRTVLRKDVKEMLNFGFSLNFYMFHGGTNFGFMGGSAFLENYLPIVTSYDYGGLLTEHGDYTPEYLVFQELFQSSSGTSHSLGVTGTLLGGLVFLLFLPQAIKSPMPVSMERLSVNQGNGQSYGYILYETVIFHGGLLTSKGHIQDRGQVFLNDKFIGVLDHINDELVCLGQDDNDYLTLRILVENQGRLSSGPNINQERKGLIGDIYLDNKPLRKFKIYSLDMEPKFLKRDLPNIWRPVLFQPQGPGFFLAILRIGSQPRDTFIKMKGWTKGVIFINGQNLGRYWSIGPQDTLYLPAPWLQPGVNEGPGTALDSVFSGHALVSHHSPPHLPAHASFGRC